MSCAEVRESLGAYALRTLEPPEAAAVAAHLEGCSQCRAELERLSVVPGYLALVPAAMAIEGPPQEGPSDRLLGRLLSAVAAERRHRRRVQWLSVAAAVLLFAAGLGAVLLYATTRGDGAPSAGREPAATTVSAVDPATAVHANLTLRPTDWGSRISMSLAGVPAGATCSLVAVGPDGEREVAATYKVPWPGYRADRWYSIDGSVGLVPRDVRSVEVVSGKQTLVTLWP